MVDQLIIGDLASNDDFGASVALRNIGTPAKKKITKSVPFSNVVHDFTNINGEIYWENRTLEYVFEMVAESPEALENMKTAFSGFVMNVIEEEIHDPFIPDFHFIGTFDGIAYADEEHELKTTATVTFSAYPYKISNEPKQYHRVIPVSGNAWLYIPNDSAHRITPTITVEGAVRIVYGNSSIALSDRTVTDESFDLAVGVNEFYVENNGTEQCAITITFRKEVF